MALRRPTPDEQRLLRELLRLAGRVEYEDRLPNVRVASMNDGGMRSLRLEWYDAGERPHQFGEELAVTQFDDDDGVRVIATLYGDRDGAPFEVDMWKTDFAPPTRIPDTLPSGRQ